MAPVADCNLSVYLSTYSATPKPKDLLEFFGCLASALDYLHGIKIRHRDIKPENILVKGDKVYLTDFGISLDWENLTRSTTTKDTAKSLIYCAPEVASSEKRNSSSDIWSLGCVFLEMLTVLNGFLVQDMRLFFKSKSESQRFYENIPQVPEWISNLLTTSTSTAHETEPWIQCMLQEQPDKRPKPTRCWAWSQVWGDLTRNRTVEIAVFMIRTLLQRTSRIQTLWHRQRTHSEHGGCGALGKSLLLLEDSISDVERNLVYYKMLNTQPRLVASRLICFDERLIILLVWI